MPNIPVNNCCGCSACYNICPKSAIKITYNREGFSYPLVDSNLCINCNKCELVCPILHKPRLHENHKKCVVAQSKTEEVLNESTSGGFIDALPGIILQLVIVPAIMFIINNNNKQL